MHPVKYPINWSKLNWIRIQLSLVPAAACSSLDSSSVTKKRALGYWRGGDQLNSRTWGQLRDIILPAEPGHNSWWGCSHHCTQLPTRFFLSAKPWKTSTIIWSLLHSLVNSSRFCREGQLLNLGHQKSSCFSTAGQSLPPGVTNFLINTDLIWKRSFIRIFLTQGDDFHAYHQQPEKMTTFPSKNI